MSILALEGALVGDARVAVRLGVGHIGAVLLMLPGIGEVDAEGLDVPPLPQEGEVRADAHIPAQGDHDVLEDAAPAHLDAMVGGVNGGVLPALDGHQGELGAVGHRDLHPPGSVLPYRRGPVTRCPWIPAAPQCEGAGRWDASAPGHRRQR